MNFRKIGTTLIAAVLFLITPLAGALGDLREFKKMAIDARGSRGGNGDVAAAYLTARDLVGRLAYGGTITIIIDQKAERILGNLLGRQVKAGDRYYGGKIVFQSPETLPVDSQPVDLYLSLANPSGTLKYSSDPDKVGADLGGPTPVAAERLGSLIDERTVILNQVVLGNTENGNSLNPNAHLRIGHYDFDIRAAGLASNEAGIYQDPVALRLRGKTAGEIDQFLLSSVGHMRNPAIKSALSRIVQGKAFVGSKFGLIYGITNTSYQFHHYLEGLANDLVNSDKSYILVTPSKYSNYDLPSEVAKRVRHLRCTDPLPVYSEKGVIYILETPTLPHTVFTGLLARSEIPSLVAGDGAMSAAINLGKPFVMTKVDWNMRNIEIIREKISAKADPLKKELLDGLYYSEREYSFSEKNINLSRFLELSDTDMKAHYTELKGEIPALTDSILAAASSARRFSEHKQSLDTVLSDIRDPLLKHGILVQAAGDGNAEALKVISKWIKRFPDKFAFMILTDRIPSSLLKAPVVRNFIEAQMIESQDRVVALAAATALSSMDDAKAVEVLSTRGLVPKKIDYTKSAGIDLAQFGSAEEVALRGILRIDPSYATDPKKIRTVFKNADNQLRERFLSALKDGRLYTSSQPDLHITKAEKPATLLAISEALEMKNDWFRDRVASFFYDHPQEDPLITWRLIGALKRAKNEFIGGSWPGRALQKVKVWNASQLEELYRLALQEAHGAKVFPILITLASTQEKALATLEKAVHSKDLSKSSRGVLAHHLARFKPETPDQKINMKRIMHVLGRDPDPLFSYYATEWMKTNLIKETCIRTELGAIQPK